MGILLAVPVLGLVLMLQTVVVSSLPLLNGTADLVLLVLTAWALQDRVRSAWVWTILAGLVVGVISAVPLTIPLAGYLLVTLIARLIRRRVWQTPILNMFLVTFAGSLITQALVMAAMFFYGNFPPVVDSINLVVLPGTLLNLLLALPIYAIVADMAQWVYPEEVEV